ncbi:uncharacterized protein LOC5510992 isoform X2 [Nematostella vectensis]|uniref:uncharacterized protein LOC5510992 isoform X2 n=1 Tax=Nematostella vectensis TaxID=45351 RepID=UPI0013903B95|nr:uncharacterized protein LOC5510992 isoform X2 [Nematostella vectensis]
MKFNKGYKIIQICQFFFVIVFLNTRGVSTSKCFTSVQGTSLIGYVFMMLSNTNIHQCFQHCKGEAKCQSLNYYTSSNTCHLSNRTIAQRPEDARLDSDSVYFENPYKVSLGSIPSMPASLCAELKRASSTGVSGGVFWLINASSVMQGYCNLTTGLMETCTGNLCQHGGTCHYLGSGNYKCACTSGFTGANCETMSSECNSYAQITDVTRNINQHKTATVCDQSIETKWYRFTGSAGTRMPTSCVPINKCNTDATGWLNGAHPTVAQGIVTRQVCFHWNSNCCNWSVNIQIRNCGDSFYVYRLVGTPNCQLRYCST